MENKQKLAQIRNYKKFRLIGASALFYNREGLSTEETRIFESIHQDIHNLLLLWDDTSKDLGLSIKPHKSYWCGKRSNKEHLIENINYCMKCYKLYKDTENGKRNYKRKQ